MSRRVAESVSSSQPLRRVKVAISRGSACGNEHWINGTYWKEMPCASATGTLDVDFVGTLTAGGAVSRGSMAPIGAGAWGAVWRARSRAREVGGSGKALASNCGKRARTRAKGEALRTSWAAM